MRGSGRGRFQVAVVNTEYSCDSVRVACLSTSAQTRCFPDNKRVSHNHNTLLCVNFLAKEYVNRVCGNFIQMD